MLALPYKRFLFRFDGDFSINEKPLILEKTEPRDSNMSVNGDTGCAVWDAAIYLAKFLESNPLLVENKKILELGSGLGLCGIACAHIGAKKITMTDLDYILPTTLTNVARNNVSGKVEVKHLDWNDCIYDTLGEIDLIIASDTVWISSLVDSFANVILESIRRNPDAQILISNQKRSEVVWKRFEEIVSPILDCRMIQNEANLELYLLKRSH